MTYIDVVDKPDIHVGVFSSPPGLKDGIDHLTVSLNKANPAVAKPLEESDHEDIIAFGELGADPRYGAWQWHYPLGAIREHVWKEAGKTPEEMENMPGFFDIAYKPSPFLQAVAKLPIFGDKAELAQFDAPHLLAEIDIPETVAGLGHRALRAAI
jgi:hypothetical protein